MGTRGDSTSAEFWQLIAASRAKWDENAPDHFEHGNQAVQVEEFEKVLRALEPQEVLEAGREFSRLFWRAYRWDLWAAAYVIEGGCSDDGFMDFRYWLISMGEEVYRRALADVHSLADAAFRKGVEHTGFEDFGYVIERVYSDQTGTDLPPFTEFHKDEPDGERFDEATVEKRFAKLYALANPPEEPEPPSLEQAARAGSDVTPYLVTGADLLPGLMEASANGHAAIARTLLDAGADVNGRDVFGQTPLHRAAARRQRHIVDLLLARGADADARDGNGRSVLAIAEDNDETEIATLLRAAGAAAIQG